MTRQRRRRIPAPPALRAVPADGRAGAPPESAVPLPRIAPGWYLVAMAAYVAIGYIWKPILMNWMLGPLFLMFALHLAPTLVRHVWSKLRTGSE